MPSQQSKADIKATASSDSNTNNTSTKSNDAEKLHDQVPLEKPGPAATPSVANDENSKPVTPAATPATPINPAEMGEELGNPMGNDVVLVPVNPRLSAPSIATTGGNNSIVDRRKRLFAAKRFFACNAGDYPIPIRKKRVARKSLGQSKHHKPPQADFQWDDFFHNNSNAKPTAATTAQSINKNTDHKPKSSSLSTSNNATGTKPKSKTKAVTKHSHAPPMEVYRGPPDEDLSEYGGWPPGWIKTMVERRGGSSKGHRDRYWFSPGGKKFRSLVEVKKFLKALAVCGGHEDEARKIFKNADNKL